MGTDELCDLSADPDELDNLLPDPVPAGVRADLGAILDQLLRRDSARAVNADTLVP